MRVVIVSRLLSGVRAVLGRSGRGGTGAGETDRLAATLAFHWAQHADPDSPVARFAATGAISESTVDALYDELVALEEAVESGSPAVREGEEWTDQTVVRTLLEYAAVHRPRGPMPGWKSLRDDRIAARVFR